MLRKINAISTLKLIVCLLFVLFFMFPIYWLILTSLKLPSDITGSPLVWFTKNITLDNYKLLFGYTGELWGEQEYVGRSFLPIITPYLVNSIFIGVFSSLIALLLGGFLAFGVNQFNFGGSGLYKWLLSLRMLPPIVVAVPMFLIFRSLSMINNRWSLIIVYLLINVPFATLLLIGFIKDIPKEISEAASIEGCNNFGIFFKIILPLLKPIMVAVFIISFIMCWNELLIANVLTASEAAQTFPVFTANFAQVERGTAWGSAAAGGVIGSLPILLSCMYIQKYLVSGLTAGTIK